jgi:hypothetical protein
MTDTDPEAEHREMQARLAGTAGEILTPAEVRDILKLRDLPCRVVRGLQKQGLPVLQFGRRLRVRQVDLEAFLEKVLIFSGPVHKNESPAPRPQAPVPPLARRQWKGSR